VLCRVAAGSRWSGGPTTTGAMPGVNGFSGNGWRTEYLDAQDNKKGGMSLVVRDVISLYRRRDMILIVSCASDWFLHFFLFVLLIDIFFYKRIN
jgi:hypothetical protein